MREGGARLYAVGGVWCDRPFRIRRLGHFGLNITRMEEAVRFYTDWLGFRVTDTIDFSRRAKDPKELEGLGDPRGHFMRATTDHHTFVLFNRAVRERLDPLRRFGPEVTVNQISRQVGSLAEVMAAHRWLSESGLTMQRVGRDMPGSNWHTYFYDPDGHTNELFWGMEQIGWDGLSKPVAMHDRAFRELVPLPQVGEEEEVDWAREAGVDLYSGHRSRDLRVDPKEAYDVEGVLLPRPFKILRVGPVSLFVHDLEQALRFYQERLGFWVTERVRWQGQEVAYLTCNTDHHLLALYPLALREALGLSPHTTLMAFGVQVASYAQLRAAWRYLAERGASTVPIPAEWHPGIDYAFYVQDPDGHLVQFYAHMLPVAPKPLPATTPVHPEMWPDVVEPPVPGGFADPGLGPWG